MFSLSAENLSALDLLQSRLPKVRRRDDPARLARRAERDRVFNSTMRAGLRHSRRTPIYCT